MRPLHCEEERSSQSTSSQQSRIAPPNPDQYQHAHQYVIPHLPGEGRFHVTAKVSFNIEIFVRQIDCSSSECIDVLEAERWASFPKAPGRIP